MSNDSRKARGMKAQVLAAAFLRPIFPWVTTVSGAAPGRDLNNTPGLAVEVKARREFDPLAWLRQSDRNSDSDEMPIVVWQPDGYGPASMTKWPYMGYLGDFRIWWAELKMLREYVQDKDPGYYKEVLKAVEALDG
jgi:hypothetical protein